MFENTSMISSQMMKITRGKMNLQIMGMNMVRKKRPQNMVMKMVGQVLVQITIIMNH